MRVSVAHDLGGLFVDHHLLVFDPENTIELAVGEAELAERMRNFVPKKKELTDVTEAIVKCRRSE